MDLLKQKIVENSCILGDNILRVDSFLNHQINVELMEKIGKEFKDRFHEEKITKIVTVESSGIAPAYSTAKEFGVDLVFARKNQSIVLDENFKNIVTCKIFSYTKNVMTNLYLSKDFLTNKDRVLIIDDFLANGEVAKGLIDMLTKLQVNIVGFGILIEKSFQKGRSIIENSGIRIESLTRIKSLQNNQIEFF